jgi:hypothetical protein
VANGVYLFKLTLDAADGRPVTSIDRIAVHR